MLSPSFYSLSCISRILRYVIELFLVVLVSGFRFSFWIVLAFMFRFTSSRLPLEGFLVCAVNEFIN